MTDTAVATHGEFSVVKTYFGHGVVGKLAKMRKPQKFSVMPRSDGFIQVQSDKSIGTFDFRTGKGILNTKGCYFPHLNPIMGAVEFEFPADFVAACLEACPALGSETTRGGITIVNTVQVI